MKRLALLASLAALLATPALAALQPGAAAPAFTAQAYLAGNPLTFKMAKALKKGPVVLYFFPAAYTRGCNLEAHLFSQAADDFKAQGATLIGVTAGGVARLAEFSKDTETCGGKFMVAADTDLAITRGYDVAYSPDRPISNRTSFVVAPDGKVISTYSKMEADDHVNQTLTALKAWRARNPKR